LSEEIKTSTALELFHFFAPETRNEVVIHHTGHLHICVANRAADEFETAFFQVFAHAVGGQ
jgi:hypothetical protein